MVGRYTYYGSQGNHVRQADNSAIPATVGKSPLFTLHCRQHHLP